MMISKEQARAAAVELKAAPICAGGPCRPDVSPEVLAAAMAAATSAPDTSAYRLAEAQQYLQGARTDSRTVASMMIQRIISDSLR